MTRYALYFAPEVGSQWWLAGCQWLGRDTVAMRALTPPPIKGLATEVVQKLTGNARRYGFHATLKAPFRLAGMKTLASLEQTLHAFCQQQRAVIVPTPQVQWMGGFLALRPHTECPAIDALAQRCVSHFAELSAPVSSPELERRNSRRLTLRQQVLLQRWGCPYTEEEFSFYLTLSDSLKAGDESTASALRDAAVKHFQITETMCIKGISLFFEPAPGTNFQLLKHYPFALAE